MQISIAGSGNVATVMGRAIRNAGYRILRVWSREEEHALRLARELDSFASSGIDVADPDSDLVIIAVSDQAIPRVASLLKGFRGVAVHTAGSVSIKVFEGTVKNYGVLYPLQRFRKAIETIPEFPLLINANKPDITSLLKDFAGSLSKKVEVVPDETRMRLHLAAVIVSNFSNHLYALAEQYCRNEQADFNLLKPLIRETAAMTGEYSPANLQTGPAIRNDENIIKKHIELLASQPELKRVYELFTASIRKFHPAETRKGE